MSQLQLPTLDLHPEVVLSRAEEQARTVVRDQIAGAVYEHTRKDSATVSVTSLTLGQSRGTRTHVLATHVGWSERRVASQSHHGTAFASDEELREHARKDQALMRTAIAADMKAWSESQRGFATATPDVGMFKQHGNPAHCNSRCDTGCYDGEVTCHDCWGSLKVRCAAACDNGKTICFSCSGTGTVMRLCTSCAGGTVTESTYESVWDYATNSSRMAYVTKTVTCRRCNGMYTRQEPCGSCLHGRVNCARCHGVGTVPCRRCTNGKIMCHGCTGTGYTSLVYAPTVRIDADTATTASDPTDSPVRHLWDDHEFIGAEATAFDVRRQVDDLMLTTHTALQFPYAQGRVQIDDIETTFLAPGAAFEVHDLQRIVAQVLEDDIHDVETVPPGQRDDAFQRLLSSKFGRAAVARHASGGSAVGEVAASVPDDFQSRVGRALDAEARVRAAAVHRKALLIAAGAALIAAIVFSLLNEWVSRKIPIELSVVIATGLVAWRARKRLLRDGPLGSPNGGAAVMAGLLRRQRVHRMATWAYVGIAAGGIAIAVTLTRWLFDRAIAG